MFKLLYKHSLLKLFIDIRPGRSILDFSFQYLYSLIRRHFSLLRKLVPVWEWSPQFLELNQINIKSYLLKGSIASWISHFPSIISFLQEAKDIKEQICNWKAGSACLILFFSALSEKWPSVAFDLRTMKCLVL